ncbi:hypothetical protein G5I_00661 [Acromyrmex echinatior]|uniref:Uncharacterized protein n=1 Tax=Acromyrmex echinatior TaxID=103372 RepID=F4W5G4_ACREC|nr:hypothetical protein G5I_00661 [Acromyrmex echinatior]
MGFAQQEEAEIVDDDEVEEEEHEGGLSTGKVADGWVDCSVPIHRDMGWRGRQLIEGGGKEKEREEIRIRVSTLVVHPMQDTARHDPRSPHTPYTPMRRVNCPVRYRAARHDTLFEIHDTKQRAPFQIQNCSSGIGAIGWSIGRLQNSTSNRPRVQPP